MNQIKKNFIYNVMYQILTIILPLITVPYVSRVLGVDGIGIYSYTYSIVYYFMLFAMLGINNYGNRTIAKCRDDRRECSKQFWSIYCLQISITLLMIFAYFLYISFFLKEYKGIAMIQTIYLFSVLFDINWFFFGLEKFKLTVIRSTILKLLSLICIFLFVRSSDDLWVYTLIMAFSTLFSQLLLLSFLRKEIVFVRIHFQDIKSHIVPCLILFVPVIAVSLYKVMDKIMLGNLSSITEVGFYEQAEKIISIPSGLVTALGTVMLPRVSNLISKGEKGTIEKYLTLSIQFMMFLAFPICFGLVLISHDFVPLFLGPQFSKSSVLIYYLSITILFISFANVIRTQYLIPNERDKDYIFSVVGGAFINLIINFLLIPKYASIGACIGTIFAELFVLVYQVVVVRHDLPIKKYIKSIFPFLINSLIMFLIGGCFYFAPFSSIVRILLQIIVSVWVYFLLNRKYILNLIRITKG